MNSVIDILEALESAAGRLAKESILRKNFDNVLLKNVFFAAQDPYTTYYVSKFKMASALTERCDQNDDHVIETFIKLLTESLATRAITGNAAKETVQKFFATLDETQQKWCLRILLRNLRVGVQESTLNKIWPGLVKSFSVQLANQVKSHFDHVKGSIIIDEPVSFPIRVEPKLDGLRCVAVKRNGQVTLFTRNGTMLETLPRIKSAIEEAEFDNVVLDGEAMADGTGGWNESASVMMSSKTQKDDSNIIYNIFDAVMFEDWERQKNVVQLHERIKFVKQIISTFKSTQNVRHVAGITAQNISELMSFYEKCMNEGYEGVMLKDISAEYVFKRSDSVLKLKPVVTFEGMIVSLYEGRRGSKREGMFGGFDVILSNGVITRVGSGFNDAFRAEVALDPESFIGKVIEMEGQPDPLTNNGLTKDGRIRFPVFIRVRPESDVDESIVTAGRDYLSKKNFNDEIT